MQSKSAEPKPDDTTDLLQSGATIFHHGTVRVVKESNENSIEFFVPCPKCLMHQRCDCPTAPVISPYLGITIIKHLCSLGVVKIEVTPSEIGREIQSKLSEIMVTTDTPAITPELKEAMEPILEFVKRGRAPSVDDDNEVLRYRYGDDFRVVTIGDLRRIAKLMEPVEQEAAPVETSGYVRLETDEPPPEGTLTVGFHCEQYWQCDSCHNVQFVGREIRCWRCGKGSMEHKEVVEPDTEAGCVWCGKVHTGMKSPCLVKPDAESKCPNCEGETHRVPVLNTSRTALFCGNCGYYRDIDKPDSERELRPVPDKPDGPPKQSPTDPDSYNFCPACGKKKQGEYTDGKESVRDSSCHDCRTPFWWPGCGKSKESFDTPNPDRPVKEVEPVKMEEIRFETVSVPVGPFGQITHYPGDAIPHDGPPCPRCGCLRYAAMANQSELCSECTKIVERIAELNAKYLNIEYPSVFSGDEMVNNWKETVADIRELLGYLDKADIRDEIVELKHKLESTRATRKREETDANKWYAEVRKLRAELEANAKTVDLALIASRRGNEVFDEIKELNVKLAAAENIKLRSEVLEQINPDYLEEINISGLLVAVMNLLEEKAPK